MTNTAERRWYHVYRKLKNRQAQDVSAKDFLEAFEEQGITTLEELAQHAAQFSREHEERWRKARSSRAPENVGQPGVPPIEGTHRRPRIPLVIDGVTYDPKDISRFDGVALHMLPGSASWGPCIHCFRDEALPALRTYLDVLSIQAVLAPSLGSIRPQDFWPPAPPVGNMGGPPPGLGPFGCGGFMYVDCGVTQPYMEPVQVQLFDDAGFQGNWMWAAKGDYLLDLEEIPRGAFLFFEGSWANVISSAGQCRATVYYFENVGCRGQALMQTPFTSFYNFEDYGWNDRVKSLFV